MEYMVSCVQKFKKQKKIFWGKEFMLIRYLYMYIYTEIII